ncbi:MAG: Methyl-accepting chemotaxis protein I (serine chemoreceptor protein) [uncultured Paraburkholderia sp.]|nr:MAG: Methyl-accepting chemotaxis protein I (serine chemoreceptor protein) [uncultured Paraburkholderia sp.]
MMLLVLRSVRQSLGGDLEVAVEAAQLMARGNLATRVLGADRQSGLLRRSRAKALSAHSRTRRHARAHRRS